SRSIQRRQGKARSAPSIQLIAIAPAGNWGGRMNDAEVQSAECRVQSEESRVARHAKEALPTKHLAAMFLGDTPPQNALSAKPPQHGASVFPVGSAPRTDSPAS